MFAYSCWGLEHNIHQDSECCCHLQIILVSTSKERSSLDPMDFIGTILKVGTLKPWKSLEAANESYRSGHDRVNFVLGYVRVRVHLGCMRFWGMLGRVESGFQSRKQITHI